MLGTLRSKALVAIALVSFSGSMQATIGTFVGRINFGTSAYLSHDLFVLGARSDAQDPLQFALARAHQESNTETGRIELCIDSIAPEQAIVNHDPNAMIEDQRGNIAKKPGELSKNPIFNKSIAHLTLRDRNPVVVLETDDVEPILGPCQKLCLVASPSTGGVVLTNTERLPDAHSETTSGIAGIAGSRDDVFAAVAPSSGVFGADGSGITLVRTAGNGTLQPVDVAELSLGAGQLVAISQEGVIGQVVDLHYNRFMRRLFVALRVKRSDDNSDGGAIALLVGRIEQGSIVLTPAVNLEANNFITNSTDFIFGFNAGAGQSLGISANLCKVRTLQTTTGIFYGIVNGAVTDGDAQNQLYAVPLVHEICDAEGTSVNAADVGRVASKENEFLVANGVDQMTRATDIAAIVGNGPVPSAPNQEVREIFTAGDTVFVCLAGRDNTGLRDANHESGIFSSTAILGPDGRVQCFSPWRRVMGSVNRALGGGVDAQSASFMYLTGMQSTTFSNVVEATLWSSGAGDNLLGGPVEEPSQGLVTVLRQEFPQACAGVHELFDFDDTTPSFQQAGTVGSITVQIATGLSKVVLVETGRKSSAIQNLTPNTEVFAAHTVRSGNGFAPQRFDSTLVMAISGGVLDGLGPLCTAEISRAFRGDGQKRGWVFAGGHSGLAVLSTSDGDGWSTALDAGLSSGFEGLTPDMSFKIVGNICGVRKLVSDSDFLYVLTADQLLRIHLVKENFSATGAPTPEVEVLSDSCSVTGRDGVRFLDLVISSKLALLATGSGLYRLGNGLNIATVSGDAQWVEVLSDATGCGLGAVGDLPTICKEKSDFSHGGNLYAIANNLGDDLTDIHRLIIADTASSAINGGTVQAVPEVSLSGLWAALGQYRSNFTLDGASGLSILPKNFSSIDYLRGFASGGNLVALKSRGALIFPVVPPDCVFNVGIVRRSSASGAWIIPGDFGIAVNE